jgi:hypothetical protein
MMAGVHTGGVHCFCWDEPSTEKLRLLLLAGKSASEIGQSFSVSRNVIIGKLYRDRSLPRLARNNGHLTRVERLKAGPAPKKKVLLPKTVSLPGGDTVKARTVADKRGGEDQHLLARVRRREAFSRGDIAPPVLGYKAERFQEGFANQTIRVARVEDLKPHHCRFPIDKPGGGVGYCGAEKEAATAYCTPHALRCFNPDSAAMRRRLSF